MPAPRLVLIDGSGYIFRAFFAMPPMTRPDGTPVNAVFGFANMLHRLMEDMPGDDLVVVFDAGKHSFRNDLYDHYKANRTDPPEELLPQFPLVREAARAFGLPVIEVEGYEADDLIAAYAKAGKAHGQEVLVVSSDKDLMQLVAQGVRMYDPMKAVQIDTNAVAEKWGVGPERLGDVLALAGDSSDNVPGVPGIGPKTAAQLINEYGDLETLLASTDKIKQPKRRQSLIDHAEQARLCKRLVTLAEDMELPQPVETLGRTAYDVAALTDFLRQQGFRSLLNRISEKAPAGDQAQDADEYDIPFEIGAGTAAGSNGGGGQAAALGEGLTREPAPVEERLRLTSLDELAAWLAEAEAAGVLAFDIETDSLNVAAANLVGVALCVRRGRAAYLPIGHLDEFGQAVDGQLPLDEVLTRLKPVLADPSILKIGHNLKFDMAVLHRYGVAITPHDDTLSLSYVLDSTGHGHGMDELAEHHLGLRTITFEEVAGSGKKRVTFDKVALDRATEYAAEDADVTLRLHGLLKPRLIEARMVNLYERFERPLMPIVARMEATGIKVDAAFLRELSTDFAARMRELEERAYEQARQRFNIGSPKQLGDVLFGSLGLPGGRKTKTGAYATGAEILEDLAVQGHDLPRTVLDWRQLQKLLRTYTEALVEDIVPRTGRVHTSFSLAATSTGRLSSSDPNLQNIPIRTEEGRKLRRAFIPEDGYVLMSADYSQIELRILAHVAGIDALKEAFAHDIDVHRVTAAQMFGGEPEQLDPDMRRKAKTINYGIIYGIGAFGLASRLGIPQSEARDYIARYFHQYPGIRDYMEEAKAEARAHGVVRTMFGRRCAIQDISASNAARRAGAERAAINAPIQGTAADIMKRAMIAVDHALRHSNLGARLLLQVHDELVLEVPQNEVEPTAARIKEVMEGAAQLSVPLIAEVGSGANWDAAH